LQKLFVVCKLCYRFCAVKNWSIAEVLLWLESHNLQELRQRFAKNQITGKGLVLLNDIKLKVSQKKFE